MLSNTRRNRLHCASESTPRNSSVCLLKNRSSAAPSILDVRCWTFDVRRSAVFRSHLKRDSLLRAGGFQIGLFFNPQQRPGATYQLQAINLFSLRFRRRFRFPPAPYQSWHRAPGRLGPYHPEFLWPGSYSSGSCRHLR